MRIFDDMAEQYDYIYSETYDAEFYLREARNAHGPVLEVACGTGRIMLILLSEGIETTGIDSSQRMLDVLKRKAKERGLDPDVMVADMRDFHLSKRFKLIILPYSSILLLSNDDKKKAIRNMVSHLAEGGRLILHAHNTGKENLQIGGLHMVDFEECTANDGRKYNIGWYLQYFPKTNSGRYKIDLQFPDEPAKSHEYSMEQFFIEYDDLEKIIAGCGLKNIKRYCGFDYSKFKEDCPEVVWIAER